MEFDHLNFGVRLEDFRKQNWKPAEWRLVVPAPSQDMSLWKPTLQLHGPGLPACSQQVHTKAEGDSS